MLKRSLQAIEASTSPSIERRRTVQDIDFIIVGSGRSGTTLVQRLACELHRIRVPPETHFFGEFAPKLLARRIFPLDERAIREEVKAFLDLKTSRGHRLDADAVIAEMGGRCGHIVDLYSVFVRLLAGDALLYGEKTPRHLMWWPELTHFMPNLKMIGVVRDPRAVVASNLRVAFAHDSWERVFGKVPMHLLHAERWAFDQRQLMRARRRLGDARCLIIKYEDVVADPLATKLLLASFLGAAVSTQTDSPKLDEITLPRETWKANVTGPVVTSRVDAWKEDLEPSQARDIAAVCHREMRRFGYVPRLSSGQRAKWLVQLESDQHYRRLHFRASRYRKRARARILSRRFPGVPPIRRTH